MHIKQIALGIATGPRLTRQYIALIAFIAIGVCKPCTLSAEASESFRPTYSFNGFATLGGVYSDEQDADFVSSWFLQPNGAGHTSSVHWGVDSKIGGQLNIRLNDKLSAVLQAVSKRGYDNSWDPKIEWANLRYQATDNLTLRVGRTVLPSFMASDTIMVGYSNLWARNPQEVYGLNPITKLDGVDLIYSRNFGTARNIVHLTAGIGEEDIATGGTVDVNKAWIINDTLEYNDFSFRAGFISADIDLNSEQFNALPNGLNAFGDALFMSGFTASAAQAKTVAARYKGQGVPIEVYSLGLRYDPSSWLTIAEWARISDASVMAKTDAWYITVGYRAGAITPYLTLAESNADTPKQSTIDASMLPAPLADQAALLNNALYQGLTLVAQSQQSATLGLRWDFRSDAALKMEYQYIELDGKSAGRFSNVQPGFTPGGHVNVISATIDLVF